MNLKELYESGKDVKDSQIPEEWRESFFKFILGQTCTMEDGEFVYYSHDFRSWYHDNRVAIERDIKINEICKEEDFYTPKK